MNTASIATVTPLKILKVNEVLEMTSLSRVFGDN